MKKQIQAVLATALLAVGIMVPAAASKKAVNKLLESPLRPTIEELIPVISDQEIPAPNFEAAHYGWNGWLDLISKEGPKFIAQLEKGFPGAYWVFMGRDTAALADMVEAFYVGIGQKNRVIRFGGSKASFGNLDAAGNVDDNGLLNFVRDSASRKKIISYAKSLGYDLSKAKQDHPFIFVDTLSRGGGRQSRAMLEIFYTEWMAMGNETTELLDRVNAVGAMTSTYNKTGREPLVENADAHIAKETKRYIKDKIKTDIFSNHKILYIKDGGRRFTEIGYEHHTYAWHGSFGPFKKADSGYYVPTPGAAADVNIRNGILWFQQQIYKLVTSPEFQKKVKAEAKALDYKFPMTRPAPGVDGLEVGDETIRSNAFAVAVEHQRLIKVLTKPELQTFSAVVNGMKNYRTVDEPSRANADAIISAVKSANNYSIETQFVLGVGLALDAKELAKIKSEELAHVFLTLLKDSEITLTASELLKKVEKSKSAKAALRDLEAVESEYGSNVVTKLKELRIIQSSGGKCEAKI